MWLNETLALLSLSDSKLTPRTERLFPRTRELALVQRAQSSARLGPSIPVIVSFSNDENGLSL